MFDLLWMTEDPVVNRVPSFDDLFIENLDLNFLVEAMFEGMDSKINALHLCNLFALDANIVRERQNLIKSLQRHPDLLQLFKDLLKTIGDWQDFFSIPNMDDSTSDLEAFFAMNKYAFAETYFEILEKLYTTLGKYQDEEELGYGLKQFYAYVKESYESDGYKKIIEAWKERLPALDEPKSITLGFNFNESFEITHVKLLSVNEYCYIDSREREPKNGAPFKRGLTDSYRLKDDLANHSGFSMGDMTKQTASSQSATHASEGVRMSNFVRGALGACVGEAGLRVRDFLKQSTRWILNLKQSLTFYIGVFNYLSKIEALGGAYCFPEIYDDKRYYAKELYLPLLLLVLKGSRPVIPNDIDFVPEGQFALLTGANQGGKTTFLRSVGVGQLMFQLGMPVGAKEAKMGLVDNIFTVFALKEEVSTTKKGKFDQEIARVGNMMNYITCNSMVLFNEPLTGTGTAETLIISREITSTIKLLGARGIWVTHLHKLAKDIHRLNSILSGAPLKSLVVQIKRHESNQYNVPTYHLIEKEPEGTSHAYDVVERFGLKLDRVDVNDK
ncbi:MAG TPA: hypothetical protein PKX70_08745 [Oscillospiraceae bacterium]|nr:hypothetical protein [Oscillospiraceae bacterium]HPR76471.1 hypothetical protein [Oscillospiraceae bacterium]